VENDNLKAAQINPVSTLNGLCLFGP